MALSLIHILLIADDHGGFTVKDQARIDFYRGHIQAMARAIDDGVEVFGSTSCCLLYTSR